MFKRLKEKWGVTPLGLALVLLVFAIGGSLSGYLAKVVMGMLNIEESLTYGFLYIAVVTLLWPLCVITVSIPFGQFKFFRNYLRKMGRRFGLIRGEQ
ncbi:MAG: hypothetical protein HKN79_05250 [Flavobacteriales bacterium]|nr:hypothetical protein [Flavobacteriales bacterium]